MGTACAWLLGHKEGVRVSLWCRRPELAAAVAERRENTDYLPGVLLPETVHVSADPEVVREGELLVVAVPCVHLRRVLQDLRTQLCAFPSVPLVSVVKGIEQGTFLRPSEILCELFGQGPIAVLSGPSHAEEFSRNLPTTVVVASEDEDFARAVQQLFATPRFRVYTNADLVGVELAAALKNIVAIAAGACDGLGFGDNAKASLMSRGLVEMTRFGVSHGGRRETFWGLAGLGDLITTCISPYGRNRAVGYALGQGRKLEEILAGMKAVPEGVWTCAAVYHIARNQGIEMPITEQVYQVLYEGKDPWQAVDELMLRELKAEQL
jgi:glycerol-3-phosphate dehydrogenase (NAD(P)+)